MLMTPLGMVSFSPSL